MGVLELLLLLTMLAVVAILFSGLYSFGKGDGEIHDKTNMLMRLRVIAQAVALGLLALMVYISKQ